MYFKFKVNLAEVSLTTPAEVRLYHSVGLVKIRGYLDVTTAERLVHVFVTTKLDYCSSLLCRLPSYQISRLQRIPNTAALIFSFTRNRQHIAPILRGLHWLPIEKRIHYIISIITLSLGQSLKLMSTRSFLLFKNMEFTTTSNPSVRDYYTV